jgi:hypothetical protein
VKTPVLWGTALVASDAEPSAMPGNAGKSMRLYSLRKDSPFTPGLLSALCVLCGKIHY